MSLMFQTFMAEKNNMLLNKNIILQGKTKSSTDDKLNFKMRSSNTPFLGTLRKEKCIGRHRKTLEGNIIIF